MHFLIPTSTQFEQYLIFRQQNALLTSLALPELIMPDPKTLNLLIVSGWLAMLEQVLTSTCCMQVWHGGLQVKLQRLEAQGSYRCTHPQRVC